MKLAAFGIAAALFFAGLCARAEDKFNPREKLDTAIVEAIRLLEAKDYLTFVKQYIQPDELKKILEETTIDNLAKSFGEGHAEDLLKVLKALKDKKPTLEDDGKKADFDLKEGEFKHKDKITFLKIDKFWYIKN